MTTTIIICASLLLIAAIRAHILKIKDNHRLRERLAYLEEYKLVGNTATSKYIIEPIMDGYAVYKTSSYHPNVRITINTFYDVDRSYARRCAEELCDKLNETI